MLLVPRPVQMEKAESSPTTWWGGGKPATLRAVIEEFVTRDTTDYGERERALEEKIEDVMRQLRRGQAQVVFDPETGTVNIVVAR